MSAPAALLERLRTEQGARIQFVRYVAIGGFVFLIDIGSFNIFYRNGVILSLATVFSNLLAVSTHFTLNRLYNFRNFERSVLQQARTYAVVAGCCLIVQLAVVEAGVRLLHLDPTLAKAVGVAVNIPLGFLGHRYLTFGHGIGQAIRNLRT